MIQRLLTYSLVLAAGISNVLAQQNGAIEGYTEDQRRVGMEVAVSKIHNDCASFGACTGSIHLSIRGGIAPFQIYWNDGSVGAFRENVCIGTHQFTVLDAVGLTTSGEVALEYEDGCVWSGDTDNDKIVNHLDLLPIALTYGESGFPRANAHLGWGGQAGQTWQTVLAVQGLPNYKHIDADGNGLININDLLAVEQNYDYTYNSPTVHNYPTMQGGVPLTVGSVTGRRGAPIAVPIQLGTPSKLAADIYGLAFTVNYDPNYFQSGTESVDFTGTWLSLDPISIQRTNSTAGKIQVSIARKDRINTTGFGTLGTLFLTIRDDVLRSGMSPNTDITISDIRLIDNQNNELTPEPFTGTIHVEDMISSTPLAISSETSVQIYPNPANQAAYIAIPPTMTVHTIKMHNAAGALVYEVNQTIKGQHTIPTNDLTDGIYTVSIVTDKKVLIQKLHVVK